MQKINKYDVISAARQVYVQPVNSSVNAAWTQAADQWDDAESVHDSTITLTCNHNPAAIRRIWLYLVNTKRIPSCIKQVTLLLKRYIAVILADSPARLATAKLS